MKISKWLFDSMLFALPVFAAEGVPGSDGARPYGDACKADSGKCKAVLQARREACKADLEKCRQERMAQREKMCAQNPEKCREMKAKMEQRRAECKADPEKCRRQHQARANERFRKIDADGNGVLSRAETGKSMSRLARHFDAIDANKDGQLSREELSAVRKHQSTKAQGKS